MHRLLLFFSNYFSSRGPFKTNSLSNLNSNEHASPKKGHKSSRASKQNAMSPSSSKRSRSKLESCDDNSENKPLSAATNLDKPNISRSNRNNTLYEKSINCLLSDLLDQTSNNLGCLAAKNHSLQKGSSTPKKETLLSNSPLTSHLNGSNSKNVHAEDTQRSCQNVSKDNQKSPSKLKIKPGVVDVIVPSFRVKNFKMRYRIEGTEVQISLST